MVTKKLQKVAKKYCCKKCDYTSKNKSNFLKHLGTTKHQMVTNGNQKVAKSCKSICGNCGRIYKYKSGLSRHKKRCFGKKKINDENSDISKMCAAMKELIKDNQKKTELLEKMVNENKKLIPMVGCNNKISINVFLNERCKDAMNLTDFVENIKVSLEDLNYTNQHGYVKGISNIFVKHLTDMKVTERPIHCSDKKRLQFYIKDENKWEKDKGNIKIDQTINKITMKQIKTIKDWEKEHPDYIEDENLLMQWHNMVRGVMGGSDDPQIERNKENIKKEISDTISVKEAME